jgi:hypothetical protein
MATFEECKPYFKCTDTEEISDTELITRAINGTPCPSKNNNTGGQTAVLGRCKNICTHFKNMEEYDDDAIKMCRLSFKLSEEMVRAIRNEEVEYSTIPFDGTNIFTPIQPSTYQEYKNIFDSYFIEFDLDKLKLVSERNQKIEEIYALINNNKETLRFPNYKGILLHTGVDSHMEIIKIINEAMKNHLKNNSFRNEVYANKFRHTKCQRKGAILKESNPTLICKKSKKLKRFDPCKGKMCWHRKGPGDSAMYYLSIKAAKKHNSYAKKNNEKTGGAYKSKKLKKSRNNKKSKKSNRSKKSNKSRKNNRSRIQK